jgi:hypothetical protein
MTLGNMGRAGPNAAEIKAYAQNEQQTGRANFWNYLFCAIASRSVSDTDPFLRHRSDGFPLRIRHRAVESFSRQQCRNGRLASERLTNETVQVRQQKRVDVRPNWKEPTADAYQARSPLICPRARAANGCRPGESR